MPFNKEILFGLSFGGDNMKMLVPIKNKLSSVSGNNSSYTFNVPFVLKKTYTPNNDPYTYTIKYPDGTSVSTDSTDILKDYYFPEGTTISFGKSYYDIVAEYMPCKWIDV